MKHIAVINKKPVLSGKASVPDGAYNGNGDLAVILGNSENGLRIYISKVDLWYGISCYNKGGAKPLGYIDIPVESTLYENYHAEQDMDKGEIRCIFEKDEKKCALNVKVLKEKNIILIKDTGNTEIKPVLKVFEGDGDGRKGEAKEGNLTVIFRSFDDENSEFETHCFAAMKELEKAFAVVVATNHDINKKNADGLKDFVFENANNITAESLDNLEKEHFDAWKDFYKKSGIKTADEYLELRWYASQYLVACGCGNRNFAPGLYSNFITVEHPAWHSDYHLNYNYQASFYAACSSNHPELTDSYHIPLQEFVENGKKDAEKFCCNGIILPVGMGPKGIYTEYNPELPHWFERLYLGQKSNAIHPADVMVFRWRATRDIDYAREHAYPYIKECLQFFEDYAVFEKGRYFIKDDAAHEVPMYRPEFDPKKREYRYMHDINNSLTLGLIRFCIPAAIDMAKEMGVDEDKQKIWQDMLDKLSPFATTPSLLHGRIFRYTEKGQRTHGDNDVGMQHIYPCNQIGLSSDKKLLKIARNTFNSRKKICYGDGNAVSSYYVMGAHLGVNPKELLSNLRKNFAEYDLDNFLCSAGAGGMEYCPVYANLINEMVLQSFQDEIRIFPDWDMDIDLKFDNLRADGAFLVSSSVRNKKIGKTTIVSEKGQKLTIVNPFEKAEIEMNGKKKIYNNDKIVLETKPNDVIIIKEA